MARCKLTLAAAAPVLLAPAATALAADQSIGGDLRATIALQGMPCDKVVETRHNGDSDYTATCKDGNRYHVFVDSSGRVVVKKL